MNTRIEICTKEDESTTVKGGILERLVAQILTVQQFEVTQTVRVTGMEIDVCGRCSYRYVSAICRDGN